MTPGPIETLVLAAMLVLALAVMLVAACDAVLFHVVRPFLARRRIRAWLRRGRATRTSPRPASLLPWRWV